MEHPTFDLATPVAVVAGESEVTLYPRALAPHVAARLATTLMSLDWERRTASLYGRPFTVPRDTCWYGPLPYAYGSIRHPAAEWPGVLVPLRQALEEAFPGAAFPTVLGNRYLDGTDHVRWHADDEPLLGPAPVIASLSLGAPRQFQLKPKEGAGSRVAVELTSGSLLVMRGLTQRHYLHRIPPHRAPAGRRINLTFRTLAS